MPQILDDNGNLINTDELDDNGNIITPIINQPETKPSFLRGLWDTVNQPLTDLPSRAGRAVSGWIDPNRGSSGLRSVASAYAESLGDTLSGLSSPLNAGMAALSGGTSLAVRAGLPRIAGALNTGTRIASAPVAASGLHTLTDAESLPEAGIGAIELAGGLMGMRSRVPKIADAVTETIPTKSGSISVTAPKGTRLNTPIETIPVNVDWKDPRVLEQERILNRPPESLKRKIKYQGGKYIDATTGEELAGPSMDTFTPDAPVRPQFKNPVKTPRGGRPPLKVENEFIGRPDSQLGGPPNKPPTNTPPVDQLPPNAEPIIRRIAERKPKEASMLREAWNLSRGLMAVDLPFITSAGFRQGLPLIGTKNWAKAWMPSIRAYGSKAFSDAHNELLKSDPLLKRPTVPVLRNDGTQLIKNGQPVLKETPSIAEQAGVHLTDLGHLSSREESIRSVLAERVPGWGKVVAASNRAYTAYINDLRLSAFRNMYEAMPDKNNIVALKELGSAVNAFTGRGDLSTRIPFRDKPASIEKYASGLSEVLFAPKLIASRMQMLNPINYVMTSPQARQEYTKAALRTAGAWMTFAGLAKAAGAEVVLDPTSADFGKIKIGNTRIDPAGGFQQFLVLAARLATGETTSSTSGKTTKLGGNFTAPTEGSLMGDFVANKLHPSLKYFYDAAFARKDRPFQMGDRAIQMAVPMMTRDLIEIANKNPELIPLLAPISSSGMGMQHYDGKDFNKPMLLPPQNDIVLDGRN